MHDMLTGALGLRAAVRSFHEAGGILGNQTREHAVAFEDWTLDGQLLRDVIRDVAAAQVAAPDEEVTPLADRWITSAPIDALDRLLAGHPGDFEDGRIALYVCQVDGDPGCATMSAEVVIGPDTVEWRNLGWQVNYESGIAGVDPPLSIQFQRSDYEGLLREALARWRARSAQDPAV